MREPPKLYRPMQYEDEAQAHARIAESIEAAMAWMQEAVTITEKWNGDHLEHSVDGVVIRCWPLADFISLPDGLSARVVSERECVPIFGDDDHD